MKITALLENTASDCCMLTEHGLSLYIEAQGKKILFDMGQTDLFYKNALTLGIDLAEVDIAILSHGHYDHGGGLEKFLEINKKAPIYVSSRAFEPHYNGKEKYICYGVPAPFSKEPPKELKGFCTFIPASVYDLFGNGFWMMFQCAETGECIKKA